MHGVGYPPPPLPSNMIKRQNALAPTQSFDQI